MSTIDTVEVTPDFKPEPRIVDKAALTRAMRLNAEHPDHFGRCWGCPKPRQRATEPHHLIFKSQGGDDLVENIVPLCQNCHMLLHRSFTGEAGEVRSNIGRYLTDDMLIYVMRKKGTRPGQEYIERRHFRQISARLVKQVGAELGDRKTWRDYPGARFR